MMTTEGKVISINKTARTAGVLYLMLAPLGFFSFFYVGSVFVAGDAATTARNILGSLSSFRLSIVSALLTQIVNLFVVLFLYKLLKPVNKSHAVFMVVFILAAAPIAMLNELNQLAVLQLLSGAGYLTKFTPDQLQALALFFFGLHEQGISIAGIFWGLWLFPMGYLIYKSGFLPKILGILLIIACFGYLIESFSALLFPAAKLKITLYTFWGELFFPLWLLIKGVNVEEWNKRAFASASK